MTVTRVLPADAAGIAHAAALIRAGEPVAMPTETVYGLAADATNGAAVARIFAAKGRPAFNPLIVHLPDLAAAHALAVLPPAAIDLAERYWPGPLTLVVPSRADTPIAALATAGLPTVALRVPAHPATRALLAAAGRPLAAPSANRSGTISPTSAAHVLRSLDGRVPLVLDGGACGHGLESTIVAVTEAGVRLLRPGPLDPAALAHAAGQRLQPAGGAGVEAPGQLLAHYAPAKPLRLGANHPIGDEWMIGFGAIGGDDTLSASGDLVEAAARLFACLHRADASERRAIAMAYVPDHGLGLAINDRLARAAAGSNAAPAPLG